MAIRHGALWLYILTSDPPQSSVSPSPVRGRLRCSSVGVLGAGAQPFLYCSLAPILVPTVTPVLIALAQGLHQYVKLSRKCSIITTQAFVRVDRCCRAGRQLRGRPGLFLRTQPWTTLRLTWLLHTDTHTPNTIHIDTCTFPHSALQLNTQIHTQISYPTYSHHTYSAPKAHGHTPAGHSLPRIPDHCCTSLHFPELTLFLLSVPRCLRSLCKFFLFLIPLLLLLGK